MWGYAGDWLDEYIYSPYSNTVTIGNPAYWNNSSKWAEPDLQKAADARRIPDIFKGADMKKPITHEEFAELSVLLYESSAYPSIKGAVYFYQTEPGTLVVANVIGLPVGEDPCAADIFGFHVHEGGSCSGSDDDPFADVGAHYNPHRCPHPDHAGDLPPLFGNNGHAFLSVLTNRVSVEEAIGRSVIVHASVDDFTTEPSGHAGAMIACGEIFRWRRR